MMKSTIQQNTGFALLLTLVVVSVVLAIGLSLLDITLKQLTLSGTGRDSEIAFHASYAGAECAQYWRVSDVEDFMDGTPPDLSNCLPNITDYTQSYTPSTNVHLNRYQMTWGPDLDRCTEVDVYLNNAESGSSFYNIPDYVSSNETCPAGAICTTIISRGFNRACNDTTSIRSIQREIVLES